MALYLHSQSSITVARLIPDDGIAGVDVATRGRQVPVDETHHQTAKRGHQQCGKHDQPGQPLPLHPRARGHEKRGVETRDQFDKGNRRKGGRRTDPERGQRQYQDARDRARARDVRRCAHTIIFRIPGSRHKPSPQNGMAGRLDQGGVQGKDSPVMPAFQLPHGPI